MRISICSQLWLWKLCPLFILCSPFLCFCFPLSFVSPAFSPTVNLLLLTCILRNAQNNTCKCQYFIKGHNRSLSVLMLMKPFWNKRKENSLLGNFSQFMHQLFNSKTFTALSNGKLKVNSYELLGGIPSLFWFHAHAITDPPCCNLFVFWGCFKSSWISLEVTSVGISFYLCVSFLSVCLGACLPGCLSASVWFD